MTLMKLRANDELGCGSCFGRRKLPQLPYIFDLVQAFRLLSVMLSNTAFYDHSSYRHSRCGLLLFVAFDTGFLAFPTDFFLQTIHRNGRQRTLCRGLPAI